jgi:hypothetical protein
MSVVVASVCATVRVATRVRESILFFVFFVYVIVVIFRRWLHIAPPLPQAVCCQPHGCSHYCGSYGAADDRAAP